MKIYSILPVFLLCLVLGSVSAQEKNINANPEKENKVTNPIATLLNSGSFEFIANTVLPTTGATKNLVGSDYSVTFSPEMINSNLPFYGRVNSGITIGRDKGMRFQGEPENFKIENKKEYQITTTVKDGDTYDIFLAVSKTGNATLSINSDKRETITYHGEIVKD
ncbi:DUF4251 domain-containing protein [Aequorivita marina]|uniref:DUF4251 domain-containing protein n=1 Tax=Aequorivita marina TaxID=3073654 RepID=UPI0028753217|nr:DUF4251 domain-containing protein [Aequorivita sp. S2608]MDS1296874.1 DUF4251 domain-containing protein [Aequorivita sp. S2608]